MMHYDQRPREMNELQDPSYRRGRVNPVPPVLRARRALGRRQLMAMTNAERQARWRRRQRERCVTTAANGEDDFALFERAASKVMAFLQEALKTPGRKQELRNGMARPIDLMEMLLKGWSDLPLIEKQRLANARNVAQMFTMGACEASRAAFAEMMLREIAANPNWPDPPLRNELPD
jgi:hypothetical protein